MQTDIEQADAEMVDEAMQQIHNGNILEAEDILRNVCSRCPDNYEYQYTIDGVQYVKFWNMTEFTTYVATHDEKKDGEVVWMPSAYPRACFYLAYVLVDRGDLLEAFNWLQKGWELEPNQAQFLFEFGVIYALTGNHQEAYECYRQGYELADDSLYKQSVALRGMGVQLIDMEQLDEAECLLLESLAIEPDNPSTIRELFHIYQLRNGDIEQDELFPELLTRKG